MHIFKSSSSTLLSYLLYHSTPAAMPRSYLIWGEGHQYTQGDNPSALHIVSVYYDVTVASLLSIWSFDLQFGNSSEYTRHEAMVGERFGAFPLLAYESACKISSHINLR